ncbi:MAG TPA: class III signal peptide-containing protein [Candidatus Bilamarchaeaceae archaeon]|nr:class III signal peptide-containing protein [Candidatus Bilamarchaeaceae archaeon]
MKGQVSAEMLILLAVVIAIVAIAAVSMMDAAKASSEAVGERTQDVLARTGGVAGCAACTYSADCEVGYRCVDGCCRQ